MKKLRKIKFGLFVILFLVLGSFLFWDISQKGITDEKKLVDYPNLTTYWGTLAPSANMWSWMASTNFALMRSSMGVGTGSGDVVGPASATDGAVVLYNTTTGKLIKDSVVIPSANTLSLWPLTYAQMRTTMGVQEVDSDLTTIAGLSPVEKKVMLGSATPAWSVSSWTIALPNTSGQILKADGTNWTSSGSLSIATFDMTSSTSSIPWVIGTASPPTTLGHAYLNSSTFALSFGTGTGKEFVLMTPTTTATANQLIKVGTANTPATVRSTITEDETDINAQALNFVTTGIIAGKVGILEKTASYTLGSGAAREAYGYMVVVKNTASTITLPVAVKGMVALVYSASAVVVRVDPGASVFRLNGVLYANSSGIDIYSAGAAGDYIGVVATTAGVWTTLGRSGTWTLGS